MNHPLTDTQRATLRTTLELRREELERQLARHQGGLSRSEHASELLQDEGREAEEHEAAREVDFALSDMGQQELAAVGLGLRRLAEDSYGYCVDCGAGIPFARLLLEPQTLRCVGCESMHERLRVAGTARHTL